MGDPAALFFWRERKVHFREGDSRLILAPRYHRQIVQILRQFLVFVDWEDDSGPLSVLYDILSFGDRCLHGDRSVSSMCLSGESKIFTGSATNPPRFALYVRLSTELHLS